MSAAAFLALQRSRRRPAGRRSPCCAVCGRCAQSRSMRAISPSARVSPARSRMTPTLADISLAQGALARRIGRRPGVRRSPIAATARRGAGSPRDVLGDARREHHRFEQRVRGEAVGAMRAGRGDFAGRPQAVERGAAVRVGQRRRPCDSAPPARPGSARAPDRCRRCGSIRRRPGSAARTTRRSPCGHRGTRRARPAARRTRRAPRYRAARARASRMDLQHEALAGAVDQPSRLRRAAPRSRAAPDRGRCRSRSDGTGRTPDRR